jgi:hypothetical protein
MECNRCKVVKDREFYSKKSNGLYYISCNECKKKSQTYYNEKKDYIKFSFEKAKEQIECKCGKTFICYNSTHYPQHIRSVFHQEYIKHTNKKLTLNKPNHPLKMDFLKNLENINRPYLHIYHDYRLYCYNIYGKYDTKTDVCLTRRVQTVTCFYYIHL